MRVFYTILSYCVVDVASVLLASLESGGVELASEVGGVELAALGSITFTVLLAVPVSPFWSVAL